VLRRHVLAASRSTLCANHAAIAGRRKITLTELRAECYPPGDRRARERRKADRRTPSERRERQNVDALLGSERRGTRRRNRVTSSAAAPFASIGDAPGADDAAAKGLLK
jgi:hypothetical protein